MKSELMRKIYNHPVARDGNICSGSDALARPADQKSNSLCSGFNCVHKDCVTWRAWNTNKNITKEPSVAIVRRAENIFQQAPISLERPLPKASTNQKYPAYLLFHHL